MHEKRIVTISSNYKRNIQQCDVLYLLRKMVDMVLRQGFDGVPALNGNGSNDEHTKKELKTRLE